MTRFVACNACGRHVRLGDTSLDALCPFCGAPAPIPVSPPAAGLRPGMPRAAMLVAGSALLVASLADCGSSSSPSPVVFYGVGVCVDDGGGCGEAGDAGIESGRASDAGSRVD